MSRARLTMSIGIAACAAWLVSACASEAPPADTAAGGQSMADASGAPAADQVPERPVPPDLLSLSEDAEWIAAEPGVLVVCDGRSGVMRATRLDTPEAVAEAQGQAMGTGDDLVNATLFEPQGGYALRNSRAERENPDANPNGGREFIVLEQRPLRVFCTAETPDAFASADMTVTRAPGNLNPNGRCGAASILMLEVRHNDAEPTNFEMIGDCHFSESQTDRVEVNLFTGEITANTVAVESALGEVEGQP